MYCMSIVINIQNTTIFEPVILTLLTYPHAEAAATYPLLFFQQLLQKA